MKKQHEFATRAIHAGQEPDPSTGAIITPIYATSTYVQESPGKHKGNDYARSINPTRLAYEKCIADLESAIPKRIARELQVQATYAQARGVDGAELKSAALSELPSQRTSPLWARYYGDERLFFAEESQLEIDGESPSPRAGQPTPIGDGETSGPPQTATGGHEGLNSQRSSASPTGEGDYIGGAISPSGSGSPRRDA